MSKFGGKSEIPCSYAIPDDTLITLNSRAGLYKTRYHVLYLLFNKLVEQNEQFSFAGSRETVEMDRGFVVLYTYIRLKELC